MPKLCIIGFDDDKVIKDFIRLHVEKLPGEKVCLANGCPDYTSMRRGRSVISTVGTHTGQSSASSCPQFLYYRLVTARELQEKTTRDAHDIDCLIVPAFKHALPGFAQQDLRPSGWSEHVKTRLGRLRFHASRWQRRLLRHLLLLRRKPTANPEMSQTPKS